MGISIRSGGASVTCASYADVSDLNGTGVDPTHRLQVVESGATRYIGLGSPGHSQDSSLRVRIGGSTYAVLKKSKQAWDWSSYEEILTGAGTDDLAGRGLAICGDYLAVGSPEATVSGTAQAGQVYVYERQADGSWGNVTVIDNPFLGTSDPWGDEFGSSLDISEDWLLIGAPESNTNRGIEYLYSKGSGNTWNYESFREGDRFEGYGEGCCIEMPYRMVSTKPKDTSEKAYTRVYLYDGSSWGAGNNVNSITINSGWAPKYGSLVYDDPYLVTSSYDSDNRIWINKRTGENTWSSATVLSGHTDNNSVDIEGDYIVATYDSASSARIYHRTGDNVWGEYDTLSRPTAEDGFGVSVAMTDGLAFVGHSGYDSGKGAIHVYERTGSNAWSILDTLQPTELSTGDYFAVCITARGSYIVGSAHGGATGGVSGKVYVWYKEWI